MRATGPLNILEVITVLTGRQHNQVAVLVSQMSFLRPDVNETFKTLQGVMVWFQMCYAIWQFVRTAKFFRLPYVMVSSMWHGWDSWIKERRLIMMRDDFNVDKDPLSDNWYTQVTSKGMTVTDIADSNVELSFHPNDPYVYLTNRHRAGHMANLREVYLKLGNETRLPLRFARDDDLLWPKVHLIRRLNFDDAMYHVLTGRGYDNEPKIVCFFDYSTKDVLNQNFVRFSSIWPLMLQARRFDFWSVILSFFIILMDLLSYFANKLWKFTQYWLSRFVKWVILQVPNRERRVFLYTFMATISSRFICRNFVTDEASRQEVEELLLMTHMRLHKDMIARLEQIDCLVEVPRKESGKQEILFLINDVQNSALAQPALTDHGSSTVLFMKQNNKKVENWTIADMAYFLQVCEYWNRWKFPPIRELLDGHNALCTTFEEVVDGVKSRSFVLCKFTKSQTLFIT